MRKLSLSLVLIVALIQAIPQKVYAEPIACTGNRFSVQTIDGQDVFTEQSCYALTEFDQAMEALNTLKATRQNIVIVYFGDNPLTTTVVETTYSKIVAADRAMAYSANVAYANASTMNVYSTPTLTAGTNITYMDDRNPLFYYGTEMVVTTEGATITPLELSALISVNGAKGYVRVSHIQIIPLIYVDNSWNYAFDVSGSIPTYTYPAQQAYYTVATSNVQTKAGIVPLRQLTLTLNFIRSYNSSYTLGLAPDWLADGKYYSPDGIVFYTDVDLTNPVTVNGKIMRHYNYYAYTNLRSMTAYTAEELDLYTDYYMDANAYDPSLSTMVGAGDDFINAQNLYGMNALMIYSMGALESGFGRSAYAQNPANLNGLVVKDYTTKALLPYTVSQYCALYPNNRYIDEFDIAHHCSGRYNLFGWGAYDSDPDNADAFVSIEAGIMEHMGINLRRGYMNPDNYVFYGSNIGNKGAGLNTRYASDPWWSLGISAIAYRVDRYLGFKDLNSIPLGIRIDNVATVIYQDPQLNIPYRNSLNNPYTIPVRAIHTPFIILQGLEVNGQLVYRIQTTNPINEDGSVNQDSDAVKVPYDFERSIGYIPASMIGDYLSILVTGVQDGASYNTNQQLFFESGTVTLNGTPISTGTLVSAEGTYTVVAVSDSGIRQTLIFTIDKTAPIITINPYVTSPTNQNVTVTASVNEGSLTLASQTLSENGTLEFFATDAAGNVATTSVTITNIDKVAPIITVDPIDDSVIVNQPVTVTASTNEGSLNTSSYTFEHNGSFAFIATDLAGNVTEEIVTINHIVIPSILTLDTIDQGTLTAANGETPISSGQTIYSTDQITLTLVLNPTYRLYRWVVNGIEVSSLTQTYLLEYPTLDTRIGVIVVKEADLNDDDKLSATDLVKLRRALAGLDVINEKSAFAADINGDGKVTTTDLVRIRRILAGLE